MRYLLQNFNNSQKSRLSEIAGNLGLIPIAAIIFPIAIGDKNLDLSQVISAALLAIGCWTASMLLLRGGKR